MYKGFGFFHTLTLTRAQELHHYPLQPFTDHTCVPECWTGERKELSEWRSKGDRDPYTFSKTTILIPTDNPSGPSQVHSLHYDSLLVCRFYEFGQK